MIGMQSRSVSTCFNLEGRHCFLTSQLVNERAKSVTVCHVYVPAVNSLIVGVAY